MKIKIAMSLKEIQNIIDALKTTSHLRNVSGSDLEFMGIDPEILAFVMKSADEIKIKNQEQVIELDKMIVKFHKAEKYYKQKEIQRMFNPKNNGGDDNGS